MAPVTRTLGIRSHLVAGIVITTVTAIGLIGLLSIKMVEGNAVVGKVREADTTARLVRAVVFKSPGGGYRAREVRGIMGDLGIRNYVVTDRSGRVLAKGGKMSAAVGGGGGGEVLFFEQGIKVRRIGQRSFTSPGEGLLVSAGPARGIGGGRVEFTMSMAGIAADLVGMRKMLITYAVVDSLIIIALGVYFLSRAITGPIKKLEATATRVAGGSFGDRAEVQVDNEIGRLATALNTMGERLEEEIRRLGEVNRELVETQDELLRSSTLAAVGRLAAGLAHEVGNPLGAVSGYLDILKSGASDKEEEEEILERAGKEVDRINAIVREFLDASRPSKGPPREVDVNAVVKECVSSLAHHSGFKGIKTDIRLKDDIPPVTIDEGKLRQVFMNLLLNAAEAMGEAGTAAVRTVTVETGIVDASSGEMRKGGRRRYDPPAVRDDETRTFAYASFRDTGPGISAEDAARLFEPFFTTKSPGRGTGLGLFVSEGIIKTYGGRIEVESVPGEGAEFKVLLPAGERDEDTGS
ncbi:MAG: ATP-binding protein [Thermodesulfobacteriota bacterium]